MAEALLRWRIYERQLPVQAESAGFLDAGRPAMDNAIASMSAAGYDLTGHQSRTVTAELIAAADLVVTMTHQHVADLILLAPDQWQKVFQLRDFVQRAEKAGRRAPEQPFDDWVAAVGSGRTRSGVVSGSVTDDIPDPVGGPRSAYDQVRRTVDELVTRLAEVLGSAHT